MQALNFDYVALGAILAVALFFFWTQKLRTDMTALLVTLALIIPWPHPDGHWRGILTYQEGFSGFGSVAVIMVTAMFVLGAAMVRTGAAEGLGGKLFRVCARSEPLLQIAILGTVHAVFHVHERHDRRAGVHAAHLAVCKERNLSPSRYLLCAAYGSLLGGQWTLVGTRSNIIISDFLLQRTGTGIGFFDFTPVAARHFRGGGGLFSFAWPEVVAQGGEDRISRGIAGPRIFDGSAGDPAIGDGRQGPESTDLVETKRPDGHGTDPRRPSAFRLPAGSNCRRAMF